MKLKRIIAIAFLIIMFLLINSNIALAVTEYERIENFESEIYINEDSSMLVEETIKVYATGDQIKRGIYRDFPTKYKDKNGNNYIVKFEIKEILRDGNSEPYKTEKLKNGVRVYIGDKKKNVSEGFHTYTIKYETNRQLGYFKNYDELYWNVTGNGWVFRIENAKATVHLPTKADMSKVLFEAYTGEYGEANRDYTAQINEEKNTVTFETTKQLHSEEGLTIVVDFEKGLVYEPTAREKMWFFISDNRGFFIGIIGVVIILIYCIITWIKVGRDPKKGIIVPRYDIPEGLSPGEVKLIDSMGNYNKVFEASIINLAVHGYLKISTTHKNKKNVTKKIVILKTDKQLGKDISEDEIKIYNTLSEKTTLQKSNSLADKISDMEDEQRKFLNEKLENDMYALNYLKTAVVATFSILICIIAALFSRISDALKNTIMCAVFIYPCTSAIIERLRRIKDTKKLSNIFSIILFALIYMFGVWVFFDDLGSLMISLLAILAVLNKIYYILIERYTVKGRKIEDQILGFKLFIKTASEDEIKEQTPENFEKYFAYAYVLGLENEWAEKFEKLLSEFDYTPEWCEGIYISNAFRVTEFVNTFSSEFQDSISSASIPPGTSSGSSSGGYSGGSSGGFSGGGGRRPEAAEAGKKI